MTVEEEILAKVRELPATEKEEVLRFADGLPVKGNVKRVPIRDYSKEMKWLEENRAKYPDLWVAIEGDRLIAADPDGLVVYNAAKAEGIETPFVVHILPID